MLCAELICEGLTFCRYVSLVISLSLHIKPLAAMSKSPKSNVVSIVMGDCAAAEEQSQTKLPGERAGWWHGVRPLCLDDFNCFPYLARWLCQMVCIFPAQWQAGNFLKGMWFIFTMGHEAQKAYSQSPIGTIIRTLFTLSLRSLAHFYRCTVFINVINKFLNKDIYIWTKQA